jgi:hypothetical protein
MSDVSDQLSTSFYYLPDMLAAYDWSVLRAVYDFGVYRGRNSEPYCHGGMSGDRCAGPHCYHKGLVSKSAMTFGIKQKLIIKIETEPLR